MDSSKIVERLEIAFNVNGNKELAGALGNSETVVSNWRTGYSKPKLEFLINKVEPKGINLHWLLTGKGDMHSKTNTDKDSRILKAGEHLAEAIRILSDYPALRTIKGGHDSRIVEIPLYQHAVAAGQAADSTCPVEEYLDLPKRMVTHPDTTYAVKACGDSMTGAGIKEGDILIVDTSIEPQHENVVIASVNSEQTVKKLYIKDGQVSLMPSNHHYEPIEITKDMDFRVQGVVNWVIRQTA